MYYEVQFCVPAGSRKDPAETDWRSHAVIEQLETEQAELQKAREIAQELKQFCTQVRIVKWGFGGEKGQVVT